MFCNLVVYRISTAGDWDDETDPSRRCTPPRERSVQRDSAKEEAVCNAQGRTTGIFNRLPPEKIDELRKLVYFNYHKRAITEFGEHNRAPCASVAEMITGVCGGVPMWGVLHLACYDQYPHQEKIDELRKLVYCAIAEFGEYALTGKEEIEDITGELV
ncbi:hypothetical protein EV702DRAFT_1046684 [Suillus placidus]|uniref:Uncharacterized protein n=1 Tax=Suillus placidus TaxID=48579 RepID=A0A9P6ZS64_9AGAM|nr:hypothetical protein EV702DRAFT_1046684 [Suillus placidus]